MTERLIELIKIKTENLLEMLGFPSSVVAAERDGTICVDVETDSPGLLIGVGGEGLAAIQHMLRLMLVKEFPESSHIFVLDINGYRTKKQTALEHRVKAAIERVQASGHETSLAEMNSYERRLAHMMVAGYPELTSESIGEGTERKLVIKKR